jgi:putative transposase
MWTPAARVQLARDAIPYATCLTDAEWALVAPFMPAPASTGRPRLWPMRLVLDGVLYVLRTGCAWAHLPRDFPPSGTVHRWFLRLARSGTFERMTHALTMADRERSGREASPTAAVVDAQAARSGGVGVAGVRGYDPARRVVGRKRHALVDTDGRLLVAAVSPASLHDSHGGIALLRASRQPWPFLLRCFADRAYAGPRVAGATPIAVTLVGNPPGQRGFAVQPRRGVVERSLAWAGRCRRLARDHEATSSSALAFFVLANAVVLVRRLARAL